MSNRKAFEHVREGTQFKAAGDEPLNAKIELRLTEAMKTQIKSIPGWQDQLRGAIAQLISDYSQTTNEE
ncbi:MAG: hypothetical protein KME21_31950 [Desmonostoc vinosum HA7617-LM4]|jgi:hypothetical protein|nr:hypothetical protein [Desmonostoc vinosum HA7617-LM4]